MPRFIRIHQQVLHVPSLANVSMGTTCLGQPFLTFYYHNQHNQTIVYRWGKWEDCEKDMIRIKTSMMEIEKTLGIIPLTDPEVVTIQVEPPKTDVVRVDVEDFQ
jgi:hypothetical protein